MSTQLNTIIYLRFAIYVFKLNVLLRVEHLLLLKISAFQFVYDAVHGLSTKKIAVRDISALNR